MRTIIVASGNRGKVREIGQILADLQVSLVALGDRFSPAPSIPETGDTFEANARQKASWVYERTREWVLADDSGLEVDALGGAPGVRSARYAGEGAGDRANLEKLLAALKGVPAECRTARFRCAMALVDATGGVHIASGVCNGRIIGAPQGVGGFGYDPVFVPDGFHRTFAQLDEGVKNAISHRGKALLNLRKELVRLNDTTAA
jgi:XTP/dITP diphosphohydrolase